MRELNKLLIIIALFICTNLTGKVNKIDYNRYVNTFIGNADNGHTFPGACLPFGLVQASPETGNDSWRYCSGFNSADDSIIGIRSNTLEWYWMFRFGRHPYFAFFGEYKRRNL